MKFIRYKQREPRIPPSLDRWVSELNQELEVSSLQKYNPTVDISEEEKHFEIQLSVPGIKKDDLNIEWFDGKLTISGERKQEEKKASNKYHRIETPYGRFQKSFFLPDSIPSDAIAATYEDGILKVVIPKEEKKVFKSTIKVK